MTIDDLPSLLSSEHPDLQTDLAHWIDDWKRSADNIEQLRFLVDKWLGNVWVNDANSFKALMQAWDSFKGQAIDGVHSQTMNERLCAFGLFEAWGAAPSEERQEIMAKVLANA